MRRLPVSYWTEAQDDLRDIFRVVLLASQNVSTARGFVQRIKDRCERIGNEPHDGRDFEALYRDERAEDEE